MLALLQCFNRFAASSVSGVCTHTIQPDSSVVAQLVNFFSRQCVGGGGGEISYCAAFGIQRVVYILQTLGAMFAASVSAKMGRF